MINAYLIDKNYQTKDIIVLTNGNAEVDVFNSKNFSIDTLRDISEINDFITIFDNDLPIYTGIVEEISRANSVNISGSNIKTVLKGIQYFVANNLNPVERVSLNVDVVEFIEDQLSKCFIGVDITMINNTSTSYNYKTEARLISVFDLLNNATGSNNLNYQIYLIGSNKMHVYINENRDLRTSIKLITNITHEVVEEIENHREYYNQIIGLGAGEEAERDYYFIDNSENENPKCYLYDIREDISHEELVRRTDEKYASLTKDYTSKFTILRNNLYDFGKDYTVGDYVVFANEDGAVFDDLITTLSINIENGLMSRNYDVTIGRYRGTLTDKINELKEGGYK